MGDSGIMTENEREIEQPADAVVAEVEEGVTPQDADTDQDEYELTVDAEPDNETAKDSTNWEAIAKAKAAKFKKQREAREKAEREKAELEQRIKRMEAQLLEKSKPKADDYYGEPENYVKAIREWESSQAATVKQSSNAFNIDDGVLEEQLESAERMRSQLKSYDKSEDKLRSKITEAGADFEQVSYGIAEICATYGIDYATSVLALAEIPGVFEQVAKDAQNERSIVRILRKASQKVKVSPKRKIETKPEPQINGGGQISSVQSEFDKAQKRYNETGKIEDYKVLAAARKRLREGN